LYNYAWFVGFFVSGSVYLGFMKRHKVHHIKTPELAAHVHTN